MADEEYHPLLPGAQEESLASAARVEEILMQKPVAASRYIQLFGWESKLLWILSGASIVVSICNYMLSFVTLCFSGHLGALELAGASIAMVGTQGFAYGIMGIWWGMIVGVILQTATLIIITTRTNWNAEVAKAIDRLKKYDSRSTLEQHRGLLSAEVGMQTSDLA